MTKRFLIIGVLVVFVAFVGFWFLILRFTPPKAGPEEEKAVFKPKELEVIAGYQSRKEISQEPVPTIGSDWVLGAPKEPEFKPFFGEEGENFAEAFLERFNALTKLPEILSSVTTPSVPEEESKAPSAPKKILTDEEWFKIAYPEAIIKSFSEIEDVMRLTGFIPGVEKFEFTSEEKIRLFFHRVIDFALRQKMIDESQAKDFRNGIDVVLPSLYKEERQQYEQELNAFLFKIIQTAYAQTMLCFRPGAPTGPLGTNTWAVCCMCGFVCGAHGCVYLPACGIAGCTIRLGCLNLICPPPMPAIWDPMTGICGCG